MKNQKIIIGISSAVLILAFVVGASFYKKNQAKQISFLAQENIEVFIRDHSPTMGSEQPAAVIVEFLDPECESCRRFYPIVKQIIAEHPGKIKLVIRYTPLHKNSKFAVRILEAARQQGKFWETLQLLFEKQPLWGDHHQPRPELIWDFLPQLGLDIEKIKQDMDNPAIEKIMQLDMADAVQLKVRGTPTFFINGKALESFGEEPLRAAVLEAINN